MDGGTQLWWIRGGARDSDTSLTVVDEDAAAFMTWIADLVPGVKA